MLQFDLRFTNDYFAVLKIYVLEKLHVFAPILQVISACTVIYRSKRLAPIFFPPEKCLLTYWCKCACASVVS